MALITCPECKREISDQTDKCPNCGYPVRQNAAPNTYIPIQATITTQKGFWSAGRLSIGIISIVLFVLVTFQSCAAGLSNAIEENGATTGSNGFFFALMMLIAGIIGICTRNSKGKAGAIITTVFYWLGTLLTIDTGETFGDLPIWGGLSFIFGIVFLVSAIKTKKTG